MGYYHPLGGRKGKHPWILISGPIHMLTSRWSSDSACYHVSHLSPPVYRCLVAGLCSPGCGGYCVRLSGRCIVVCVKCPPPCPTNKMNNEAKCPGNRRHTHGATVGLHLCHDTGLIRALWHVTPHVTKMTNIHILYGIILYKIIRFYRFSIRSISSTW